MSREVGTALDMIEILGLHLLLIGLPVIEIVEVAHNNGNWQSNCQNPGNGTQGPNYFSPHTNRPD